MCVLARLQVEVTQDEVDGEHGLTGVDALVATTVGLSDGNIVAIGGNFEARILGKLGSQRVGNAAKVFLLAYGIGLADAGDGLGVEGYAAIDLSQLQISPCTDGQGLHILWHADIARTREQGGVAMSNEVVAVVDDAIEHIGRVVLVLDGSREVGQGTKVGLGVLVDLCEVATHLIDQHILVDGLLHTLENAERVEH